MTTRVPEGVQHLAARVQPTPVSGTREGVALPPAVFQSSMLNEPPHHGEPPMYSSGDTDAADAIWSQLKQFEMTAATPSSRGSYGEFRSQPGQGWTTQSQSSAQQPPPSSAYSSQKERSGAQTPISMFMQANSRVATPNMAEMLGESENEYSSDEDEELTKSFSGSLSQLTEKIGVTPFVKMGSVVNPTHHRSVSFGDDPTAEAAMSQQAKRQEAVKRHNALAIKAKADAEATARAKNDAYAATAAAATAAAEAHANAEAEAAEVRAEEQAAAAAAQKLIDDAEAAEIAKAREAASKLEAEAEAAAAAEAKADALKRHEELAVKAKRDAEANALAKQLAEEEAAAAAAQKLIDDAEAAEIAKAREAASKLEAKKRLEAEERQYKAAQAKREKERLAKVALEEALENKRLREEEEARQVEEEKRLEEERRVELDAAKEAELAYDQKLKDKMAQKKAAEAEARENALLAREEKKRVDAENARITKQEKAQKKTAKLQALAEKKRLAAESEKRAHEERLSQMSSTEKKLYMEQVEQQRKEAEFAFRSTYFASGDADGDGMLSLEEALQQGMDESTFRAIDADGNGQLTLDEFADWQVRNRPKGDFMG